jgi:hypothetical protein
MLVFQVLVSRDVARWGNTPHTTPLPAKVAGVFSLCLWVAVVAFGRWIGFTLHPTLGPASSDRIGLEKYTAKDWADLEITAPKVLTKPWKTTRIFFEAAREDVRYRRKGVPRRLLPPGERQVRQRPIHTYRARGGRPSCPAEIGLSGQRAGKEHL